MSEITIKWGRLTEVMEMMCEDYCMWPLAATSDDTLKLHCNECPLNNIGNEEYWENRGEDG